MDLLADILRECMHFRNFIEILQTNLEGIENILTFVQRGTVSETLTDLRLEKYLPNFEKEDLEDAYQLIQTSFDIEEVELPTRGAKRKINDRIQSYRHELSTIKDRIHEVKDEGEKCHQSCQGITHKFNVFLREIDETQEAILTLLGDQHNEEAKLSVLSMIAGGLAITSLALCLTGAVGMGVAFFSSAEAVISVSDVFLIVTTGALSAGAAATAWDIRKQMKEVEKVRQALDDLQGQLNDMNIKAGMQRMAWREIETEAEKIVHYIDHSKMERTADGLNPSHRRPVQDVLDGVHVVLEDAAFFQANVVEFKTETQRVQENLRQLSLMDASAVVLATPGGPPTSPLAPLYGLITRTVNGMQTVMGSSGGVAEIAQRMGASLTVG
ncbi:Hypp984 [Branchiostoma lanceolatum]|uniref:Hypp984 protein n=1 Tax=Branchiostoma lanceolatum TaxID=7740 RepID=A0A8J9ZDQ4_BRALA|nr:Hypp984 [Branchiostoma lanceolatum]